MTPVSVRLSTFAGVGGRPTLGQLCALLTFYLMLLQSEPSAVQGVVKWEEDRQDSFPS